MEPTNRHMISSINWSTSIDSRELSEALQQKISHWNNFHLEREVNRIFDRICPDHQQWRIPQMELDLGIIDYDNLEQELSRKIPLLIEDKLKEFLLHQQLYGNREGLIEETQSKDELWESVLLRGLVPWWYEQHAWKGININVSTELRENRKEFIRILNKLAKKAIVRKRLAWQLESTVLEHIVVAVEPSNYQQIFDFKKEVEESRQRSKNLQSDGNEFRKSLWLWILNYLFEERGTFFNKVAYMQSLIVQMAAHYNLHVISLLNIIRDSAHKVSSKLVTHSEFINLIDVLIEKNLKEDSSESTISTEILWERIEAAFQKGEFQSLNKEYELNDVINHLLEKDAVRMIELITKSSNNAVLVFSKCLNISSLFKVIESYTLVNKTNKTYNYIEHIYQRILSTSTEKKQVGFIRRLLLYLKNNFGLQTFDSIDFFNSAVFTNTQRKELLLSIERKSSDKEKLLDLRLDQDIILWNNKQVLTSLDFQDRFNRLLEFLYLYPTNQELIKELEMYVRKSPIKSFEYLERWEDKDKLRVILPLILNEENLHQLILANETIREFAAALQQLAIQDTVTVDQQLFEHYAKKTLHLIVMHYLTKSKAISKAALKKVFKELLTISTILPKSSLIQWLKLLNESNFIRKYQLDITAIVEEYNAVKEGRTLKELLLNPRADKEAVANLYIQLLQSNEVSEQLFERVIIYLFGEDKFSQLQKLYKSWEIKLITADPKIAKGKLQPQLMNCFVDYSYHKGSITFLEKLIQQMYNALGLNKAEVEEDQVKVDKKSEEQVKFTSFISIALKYGKIHTGAIFDALLALYRLIYPLVPQTNKQQLENFFIVACQSLIKKKQAEEKVVQNLLAQLLSFLQVDLGLTATDIAKEWNSTSFHQSRALLPFLKKEEPIFELLKIAEEKKIHKDIRQFKEVKTLQPLISYLIKVGKLPIFVATNEIENPKEWIKGIKESYPIALLSVLLEVEKLEENNFYKIEKVLPFEALIDMISYVKPAESPQLEALMKVYHAFRKLPSVKLRTAELQKFIYTYLFNNWKNENFERFSAKSFWIELIYYFGRKYHLSQDEVINELIEIEYSLPQAFSLQLKHLDNTKLNREQENASEPSNDPVYIVEPINEGIADPIPINNAGLVIINNYLKILFERLNYLNDDGEFINEQFKEEAVHVLQYIATGQQKTEEVHLALNKVLSGMAIHQPVREEVRLSKKDEELIEGLIQAMINYWDAIGESSIDGFRGNWLVREGILTEYEEHWELVVEKKAYDILLENAPFSFSVIKYPWMDKPLKVNWPY